MRHSSDRLNRVAVSVIAVGLIVWLAPSAWAMQLATGSYIGDGVDGKAVSAGFQPNLVIIKARAGARQAVWRSSAMSGDFASYFEGAAGGADLIQSLTSTGFTVGTDVDVNELLTTYDWVAIAEETGELKVGSYSGDGGDNRSITGVGFQPDVVWIKGAGATLAKWRTSSLSGDASWDFTTTGTAINHIQALETDGFQVGGSTAVNTNGTTYYYVAMKKTTGIIQQSTYTGDGADNRSITGVGFQPTWVFLQGASGTARVGVHRPSSLSGDSAHFFDGTANAADRIQALQADGFQVGTHNNVNGSGTVYHYVALKTSPTISVAGTVYSDEGSTALTGGPTVRIKVNGAGDYSALAHATTGAYSVSNIYAPSGAVITVYLDTGGLIGSATTVTRSSNTNLTGIHLYQNRLIVRKETGSAVTNTDLGQYDKDNDSDIHFTANGGTLTVDNDYELHIWAGVTFRPGGSVTLGTGGTHPGGDAHIESTGTLDMDTSNLTVGGGDLIVAGTFTSVLGSTTVKGTSAAGSGIGGGSTSFFTLNIGDSTTSSTITAGGNLTVTGGFVITSSSGTNTFDASDKTMNLTGIVSINDNFDINGETFTAGTSTVVFDGASTSQTIEPTTYYHLQLNKSGGTFTAGGNLTINGNVTLTAGTLASGANNLTVGTGTGTGHIVGAGALTQSASGTTTLKGSGNLGGTSATTPGTCSGANGSYSFYNLTLGDGSNTKTTTACGSLTVSNVLTVSANHTLDGASATITLAGTGTPFSMGGADRLTEGSSTVIYTNGTSANVTATTYNHLEFNGAGTFTLGTGAGQTITTNGAFTVTAGTARADTHNPNIAVNGVGAFSVALTLQNGTTWTKGSGTVTLGSSSSLQFLTDNNTTKQDFGAVVSDNNTAQGLRLGSAVKLTSLTINSGKVASLSGQDATVTGGSITGAGTLYCSAGNNSCGQGTITVNGSGTIGGSGSFTFRNLTLNGSGPFSTGGDVTAVATITAQAGTLAIGGHTVTAANMTISGGTLSMASSGGKLKISGSGTLSMSSGAFTTSDVATPVEVTTSDTATPTYVGVSLTGGTLNVAELDVNYLKSTGLVIGSGVTLTACDKVRWGSTQETSGGTDVMLDVTGQTKNLVNHVFPASWGGEVNVRANTSGTVTMWDWSGAFGGEANDSDNSGGEVIWKGLSGGTNSGSVGHPAIY